MQQQLTHLITYARQTDITVEQLANIEYLEDLFHLPLSQ
jgi:hypothetical protein